MINFFKWVIAVAIVLLSLRAFGQDYFYDTNDSLKLIKLRYQMLDSNALKRKIGLSHLYGIKWANVHSDTSFQFAYRTDDKNLWTMISLPSFHFNFNIWGDVEVSSLKWINIDRKGNPELVVWGYCNLNVIYKVKWLKIISIDKVPAQIFSIFYGLDRHYHESFYVDDSTGATREIVHVNSDSTWYEAGIDVSEEGITINGDLSELDYKSLREQENDMLPDSCRLTKIPSGRYVLRRGRIKRENR
jgi:hypothetical protein